MGAVPAKLSGPQVRFIRTEENDGWDPFGESMKLPDPLRGGRELNASTQPGQCKIGTDGG